MHTHVLEQGMDLNSNVPLGRHTDRPCYLRGHVACGRSYHLLLDCSLTNESYVLLPRECKSSSRNSIVASRCDARRSLETNNFVVVAAVADIDVDCVSCSYAVMLLRSPESACVALSHLPSSSSPSPSSSLSLSPFSSPSPSFPSSPFLSLPLSLSLSPSFSPSSSLHLLEICHRFAQLC